MAKARTRLPGRTGGPGRTQRRGTSGTNRPVRVLLLVGTKKGAFVFRGDGNRKSWKQDGPFFLGNEVNHLVLDPRDNRTMLMAARTGHLGPTVFRSTNSGRTWREARRPPAFPKAADGPDAKVVERSFWLSPGHPAQPGTWYAGTSPHGLFRSDDGGISWEPVSGFNEYVEALKKREGYIGATPGGLLTHSILVDPRGPATSMWVSPPAASSRASTAGRPGLGLSEGSRGMDAAEVTGKRGAGFILFPLDCSALTVEYTVNLIAPADGEKLIAIGRVINPGRTLTICELEVVSVKEGRAKSRVRGLQILICLRGRPDLAVAG